MKSSKYNFCLPYEDHFIIFNGVSKRFFQVSNQNKDAFLKILSTPDRYINQYNVFFNKIKNDGFVIEDSVNELEIIKKQYSDMNSAKTYKLMILPTYSCNVDCWYCIQNHQNVHLCDEDIRKIKKHIVYYLTHNDVRELCLMWFGGEPLTIFDHIVSISLFAQQFCKKHSISFSNTITTNGILISQKKLEIMKKLDFRYFQITIDGIQEVHDKVKVLRGKSAFKTTLQNIDMIAKTLPLAEINIRYNYTMKTLHPDRLINELNHFLPKKVRQHCHLSIMKVWQEKENLIDEKQLDRLVENAYASGYHTSVGARFGTCYVDSVYFNCIFPNGMIDKCDNLAFEKSRGRINDDGSITWEMNPPYFEYNIFTNPKCECLECKYLPLCYGPCPMEREKSYALHKPLVCRHQNRDKVFSHRIFHYCKSIIMNHKD